MIPNLAVNARRIITLKKGTVGKRLPYRRPDRKGSAMQAWTPFEAHPAKRHFGVIQYEILTQLQWSAI
jgi:hypothetical protein